MKKRLLAFALATALLCGSLVGCDVNGGLVGKLLAGYEGDLSLESLLRMLAGGAIQNELVGELTTPNGDVIEIETDINMDIPWPSETWDDTTWWEEETWGEVSETEPVPDETINDGWDTEAPDVQQYPRVQEVIVLDGDLSDWEQHSHIWAPYVFDASNLDAWVGEVEDKGFTMYIAADQDYAYFAFDVIDDAMLFSEDGQYRGDAFQIQIDFNGWVKDADCYERAIFYSFGLQEDGTVDITVQCMMDDAVSSIDYMMASDDEEEWREGEVKGATKKKDNGSGWVAEFAISWETLHRDVSEKLMTQSNSVPNIMLGKDAVDLNMLICYLDHDVNVDGSDAGIVGAWGTSIAPGALMGQHPTVNGWTPYGPGVIAHFAPAEGTGYIESIFQGE